MWRDLAKKCDAQLLIIECMLHPDLHKKRIESRVRNMHGLPEVTWNDVENRCKDYLPWHEERLIIDSALSIKENLDRALDYLKSSS